MALNVTIRGPPPEGCAEATLSPRVWCSMACSRLEGSRGDFRRWSQGLCQVEGAVCDPRSCPPQEAACGALGWSSIRSRSGLCHPLSSCGVLHFRGF